MKKTLFALLLPFFLLGGPLQAQEARSLGLGSCGTALSWGPAALVWNPAALKFSAPPKGYLITAGATAFDSTNIGGAALDFDHPSALRSSKNPVLKGHDYRGLTAIQIQSFAFGILYDQRDTFRSDPGTLLLFENRANGAVGTDGYGLSYDETDRRMDTVALAYSQGLPMGQASGALGTTLKIHQGTRYRRTLIEGLYTPLVPGGYSYRRWTAGSGSGFSWDAGFMLRLAENFQGGVVMENLNSSFKWKTQREDVTLDPSTGWETVTNRSDETVVDTLPRTTRWGLTLHTPDDTSALTAESVNRDHQTLWHFGYEKVLPAQHLVLRLGTFHDPVVDKRLWSIGVGYSVQRISVDLGITSKEWPVVQDSEGFGLGFSAIVLL